MTELTFTRLGPNDIDELYLAMREIMIENQTHNVDSYDKAFWKWQYQDLPGKRSFVYVGKNIDGKILAYYHVPIYIGQVDGKDEQYAMIQDVAVSASLRGQGVFKRLAIYANEDLDKEGINIIYTFPNHKSIHTFEKYNAFSHLDSLPSYILPLDNRMMIGSKFSLLGLHKIIGAPFNFIFKILFPSKKQNGFIERANNFTDEITKVYHEFTANYAFGINRSKEYLNWRYINKPKQNTHILTLKTKDNVISATAVLKEDIIMGIPTLLLMDFAHTNKSEHDLIQLLRTIRLRQKELLGKQFGLLFITSCSSLNSRWKKAGSFKLPEKLVPRPLNLLARSSSNLNVNSKSDWLITLSDWDVL